MNRNVISALCFGILLVVFCFYRLYEFNDTLLLGVLGSIATLYFGLLRTMSENDRIFKELFQEFNARYDDEFNDLLNDLRNDQENNKQRTLNNDERKLIIDYLNLSAEEFLWRSKNRIDKKVWEAWKAGIKDNLEITLVANVYKEQILTKNGKLSFYGLVEELNITK